MSSYLRIDGPRERLDRLGPQALSDSELLAIIVGSGCQRASALDVGQSLIARFGIGGLRWAAGAELCGVEGCGPATAAKLRAAVELGTRIANDGAKPGRQIRQPADAAAILSAEMAVLEQEHLRVVLLNTKNRVVAIHEVYKGSVSASLVRASEVFREAIRRNAPAIIVAHNHPSGDPSPSPEDLNVTRQLARAGELLDIQLLDHLIIGRGRWVSLRERGAVLGP